MYKEIIDHDIYKWLLSLNILSQVQYVKELGGNRFELDEHTSRLFTHGKKIGEVLRSLMVILGQPPNKLSQYKDGLTKEDRHINWNLNEIYMKKFGFTLDPNLKLNFMRGDRQKVNTLLKQLLDFSLEKLRDKVAEQNQEASRSLDEHNEGFLEQDDRTEFRTLLDYVLHTLKTVFALESQNQAIGLLAQKNKYLAQVIHYGLKKDFAPVRSWLALLLENF